MTAYLITTPLTIEICVRCHTTTLHGHAGGIHARLDPHPIDSQQELAALLAGKCTYDVYIESWSNRMYVEWRDFTRINADRKHPVVAQHKCQRRQGPPPPQPVTGGLFDEQPDTEETEDIPPF